MQPSPTRAPQASPVRLAAGGGLTRLQLGLLSLGLAAAALCRFQAGVVALAAAGCGLWLLFSQLCRWRSDADARAGLPEALREAERLLERGAPRPALRAAQRVAERAGSGQLERAALELCAWCQLAIGEPQAARDALSWAAGSGLLDPYCVAAVEDACGQALWALHLLERAARRKRLSRQATLLRIDLCARLRGVEAACSLTLHELGGIQRADAQRVLCFAHQAGCGVGAAAELALALEPRRAA